MSTTLAQNAGLGPCDLQDPPWAKMSAVPSGVTKKRKKSETKPQSQINKCLNEKRRREQENLYIEELAELISASFADMSSLSVKPDKCAILQETVNQIKTIKQQEVSATSDAVQQGEVSSSKPTILSQELFGPLLLEALEGFLFVVNPEGKVEYVTENVSQFIKFTKEDVLGKSIYNYIHLGDHARFTRCLRPNSVGWTTPEPQGGASQRGKTFNCRLLVKPPGDQEETMEEKQQRVSKYETMQISSTQLPFEGDKSGRGGNSGDGGGGSGGEVSSECGEVGPCLMCVARRISHNEKHLHLGAPIEQFTMKLDVSGKIIAVDPSNISSTYSQLFNKDLMNRKIQELCHQQDLAKLTSHLNEALTTGLMTTSAVYRLRVSNAQEKYIHVQTKSKLFKYSGHERDFIMSTHSIIGENEVAIAEAISPHSGGPSSNNSSIGGPLMIGSINGNTNQRSVTSSDISNTNFADLDIDFSYEPYLSTPWVERPESRQSLTPAPSPSPLIYPVPPQPSPIATTSYQSSTTFPFSPLPEQQSLEETKDSKENMTESGSEGGDRLRGLLTSNKRSSTDSDDGGGGNNHSKHHILKGLLNQTDEEDRGSSQNPVSDPPKPKASSGNNMLLQLLNNERADDQDLETQAGIKKQNELLHQLLKSEDNKSSSHQNDGQTEDPILKIMGFHSGSPSPPEGPQGRARKRPSEDGDDGSSSLPAKRGPLSALDTLPPVSSTATGNSKLWEKNKMLASLLAKQPSTPTSIPHIPASVISATPQDKLPRLINKQAVPGGGWSGGSIQQTSTAGARPNQYSTDTMVRQRLQQANNTQQQQQVQRVNNHIGNSTQYLHTIVDQQQQQRSNVDCRTNANVLDMWESQTSSDPLLSELLDQVIDIVPDAIITDSSAIMNILDAIETPVNNNNTGNSVLSFQQMENEKMAISAIQKSLMLCESAVKGTMYNSAVMTSNQQQFPPPPMYQQRPRFSIQQSGQLVVRAGTPQYAMANQQQQQQLILQRNKLIQQQQQQQKQRLLQQQQQQQLLIPSNAAATPDPGMHSIDSLINNTVAPNVSLQRSSSVPDSQLSPVGFAGGGNGNGGGSMLNSGGSQISPSQRQPYSPLGHQQPFSPVNGMSNFQQQQQQQQQQQSGVQARLSPSGLPTFQQAQLSPRVSQAQQQQQAYTVMSQANSWSQQQQNRLTLQQQQNPMLNAQLTGGPYNTNRSFVTQQRTNQQQLPPVRSLTSPGSRQSPFPPEVSPTTGASYQQSPGNQYRLQRTISAPPQATTQLPGGVRHYAAGLNKEHHPLLSPSYPPHPVMYPHPPDSPQFCYDQSTLQLYGASCDRSRLPGGGNNGMTEYVRQELRAMVGARTGASQTGRPQQQQVQVGPGQQVSPADLEALGLSFEMPNNGGSESPKMWGNVGSEMSAVSPQPGISRTNMEEVSRSSDQKSSLLQKLLSE